ncbi:MAG: Bax inhibitor-1 family protein [Flavobacteriales bacterium]|nr:Bax inhibitor-1 family protein [Flavobacteriales bacterium]
MSEIIIDHELVANSTSVEKAEFYKKTYAHVAGAFLVFLVLEGLFLNIGFMRDLAVQMTQGMSWLIVLGLFMLATTQAEKMVARATSINKQYLGLFIYVLAEAIIFVPLMMVAMAYLGTAVLMQAMILTIALFAGLSAVVLITKKDFSFMRSIITVGSIIALGLIVAGIIFGFDLGLWFSGAMVLLAAGSILYQTSNMIYRYSNDQYVLASLGLFASFMLLLWYIIQIFLSRD